MAKGSVGDNGQLVRAGTELMAKDFTLGVDNRIKATEEFFKGFT